MMLWIITVIALAGIILNIQKKRECFLLWMFSNFNWAIYNFRIGEYTQAVLFTFFFFFSFLGFGQWSRAEKNPQLTIATETFCRRILRTQKIFTKESNRIKINWIFTEAKKLLRIIEDEET